MNGFIDIIVASVLAPYANSKSELKRINVQKGLPMSNADDILEAAVLKARAEERERCVKACARVAKEWDENSGYSRNPNIAVPQDGCDDCMEAIRALGELPAST